MFSSKVLAMLSVSFVAAALFINESTGVSNPNISQGCFRCLCHISTYCTISNECEDSHCGPFNISRVYWKDAGKVTLPDDDPDRNDAWKDCAKDYLCAQKIVEGYIKRFSKDCNGDGVVDCFDYMMINSNGGSDCSPPLNSTIIGRILIERSKDSETTDFGRSFTNRILKIKVCKPRCKKASQKKHNSMCAKKIFDYREIECTVIPRLTLPRLTRIRSYTI